MGSEWNSIQLGEVAKVGSGFAFKSEDMGTEGVPIIKIKNLNPPDVNLLNCERVPLKVIQGNKRIEKFRLLRGDILIAMTGATVGKISRFPATSEDYYLNQRVGKVALIRPDIASYSYLYYVLSMPANVEQIFSFADGSAQANVSGSQIESISVPFPPLLTQTQIASILGSLDDKIELNRKTAKTLEEMAQALFRSWFVDFDPVIDNALAAGNSIPPEFEQRAANRQEAKARAEAEGRSFDLPAEQAKLFPDGFEESELGPIPIGWTIGCISQIAKQIRDSVQPAKLADNILHHFSLPAFDSGKLPTLEPASGIKSNKFRINEGDILVSKLNPHIPRMWHPVVEEEAISVASTEFLILRPQNHSSSAFLYSYFLQPDTLHSMQSLVNGTSNSHQRIDPTQFMASTIVVPPNPIHNLFKQTIEGHLERSRYSRSESATLSKVRDSLLPKLISGEIQVA